MSSTGVLASGTGVSASLESAAFVWPLTVAAEASPSAEAPLEAGPHFTSKSAMMLFLSSEDRCSSSTRCLISTRFFASPLMDIASWPSAPHSGAPGSSTVKVASCPLASSVASGLEEVAAAPSQRATSLSNNLACFCNSAVSASATLAASSASALLWAASACSFRIASRAPASLQAASALARSSVRVAVWVRALTRRLQAESMLGSTMDDAASIIAPACSSAINAAAAFMATSQTADTSATACSSLHITGLMFFSS
mmetsp:Transcript_12487/g.35562  ORF Transcript_12487/g.35562 Transcript_12487/m.35562 type:complete len:256 (+) Transcript_12487:717-1484(+)